MFGNTKYEKKDRLVQFFVSTFLDCLHYYKPDDNHELEFLIEKDGRVIPIEVKSGNTDSVEVSISFFIFISFKLIPFMCFIYHKSSIRFRIMCCRIRPDIAENVLF